MKFPIFAVAAGILITGLSETRSLSNELPATAATNPRQTNFPQVQPIAEIQALSPAQRYDHGDPTGEEQLMLELANRARSNPAAEAARLSIDLNDGLASGTLNPSPKPPLALNRFLLAAARNHSQWLLNNQQFSHTGENGTDPGGRMTDAGYSFIGSWNYAENISFQGTTQVPDVADLVAASHDGLFVDEGIEGRGHRINLLNKASREVGIGIRVGPWEQSGRLYNVAMSTQDFASSDGSHPAYLVGVIFRDDNQDGFYTVGEGVGSVTVMPDRGNYYAISSASGGYAIPLGRLTGQMTVTFSSAQWPVTITKTVTLTGVNVKRDIELNADLVSPPAAPRFSQVARHPNGGLALTVEGSPGQMVTIQGCSDLSSWQDLGSLTLSPSPATFLDSLTPGQMRRFYRAVLKP
jgi:uncharacterized protein YkwD